MKRQLDRVLEDSGELRTELVWRPFQLYPELPLEGLDRRAYLKDRYGESADASRVPEGVNAAATDMGLALDYSAMQRVPNTLLAHRLMDLALHAGCQHQLAEVLFEYHFLQGRDVGDAEVLVAAAASVGLDGQSACGFLESAEGTADVLRELTRARDLEIFGVPCILIEERFRIPGAQGVESLGRMLKRAQEKLAEPIESSGSHA